MVDGEPLYLDWNATTPLAPEVLEAMVEAAEATWANPASVHRLGRRARQRVEEAREAVAELCGYDPRDVVLTSGGTEANNLALAFGATRGAAGSAGALVVSEIEHPSVVEPARAWGARGAPLVWVAASPSGRVEPEAVADALDRAGRQHSIGLVSVQAVNHETGVIHPIEAIAELVHARGLLLHVDAVQAAGRLPPSHWRGADLVAIAGHKMRGPKGIGALITAPRLRLSPILRGGSQERGLRPGTQDPVACAGLQVAARRALASPPRYAALAGRRDELERRLSSLGVRTTGSPIVNGTAARAPHVSSMSWPGWLGPELCAALDLEGVCVSSGSACSAGTADPSPVIAAIAGMERARSAVRISFGESFDERAIDRVVAAWERVLRRAASRTSRSA